MDKVYMADVRAAKFCSRGTRDFFKIHNLDWFDFVENGIDEEKLLSTEQGNAIKLVEVARGRK